MDQDSRSPDPRRSSSPRAGSEQGQSPSSPLRIRQRELKSRSARATASSYLDKLLQTVSNTSQTAPIATSGPMFDRCVMLVQALGDPDNPAHIHAAEELVALGPVALPVLIPALNPDGPWLTAYRAAEVLGEIGDRRAAPALVEALNHPNSNVRWSVVRALSAVGNTRALFALRRLAREDRSKTSWGESVAGVAQSAIDQMQGSNMMLKTMELVKTAISTVVFLLALVVAWNVFERVRGEMTVVGMDPVATVESGDTTTDAQNPAPEEPAPAEVTATTEPTPQMPVGDVVGVVLKPGNVRSQPAIQPNNVVGQVEVDDQIVYLATTPDRSWFKIRLGENRSAGSAIDSPDGMGWVNKTLVDPPTVGLPIEDMQLPTRAPATSATPTMTSVVEPTATAVNAEPTVDPLQPQPTTEGDVVATATPELILPTETPTP